MGRSQIDVQADEQLVQKSRQILARGNAADGPGQDVVEHQRGDGKLRERAAHRLFDDAIDAAAHEHAAALDVHGSHGVGEQHDGQNEPGSGLADGLLGDRARIEGGRAEVIEYDGGRPPEGNEGKHGGRGNHDFGKSGFLSRIGRLWNLVCGHICLDWYPLQRCERRGCFLLMLLRTEHPGLEIEKGRKSGAEPENADRLKHLRTFRYRH